ncbi:hypothetical protein SHIRM173S_13338 [Streptomyces hirsutus]
MYDSEPWRSFTRDACRSPIRSSLSRREAMVNARIDTSTPTISVKAGFRSSSCTNWPCPHPRSSTRAAPEAPSAVMIASRRCTASGVGLSSDSVSASTALSISSTSLSSASASRTSSSRSSA